jgi:hypothetical protein
MDKKGYRKLQQAYSPEICVEGMRESMEDLKLVGELAEISTGNLPLARCVLLLWEPYVLGQFIGSHT